MKTSFLKIVALVLAMLMMVAVFAGCGSKDDENTGDQVTDQPLNPNTDPNAEEDSSPKAVVKNSLLNFVKDVQARPELASFVNTFKKGSIEIQAGLDAAELQKAISQESYTDAQGAVSIGGKLFFAESSFFLKDFSVIVSIPEPGIDVDVTADLYYSAEYAYINNDEILGGAYGIIRGEMADAFKSSAWVSEIPAEAYEIVVALLEAYDNGLLDEASKDVKNVLTRYIAKIGVAIEKNADYTAKTQKVTVGGEEIDSRVITVAIDEKAVIAIFNDLYNELKNDKELRDLVVEYGDVIGSVAGAEAGNIGDMWDEMLDMLGETIKELEKEMTSGTLMIDIATPENKSVLRKLTLSYKDEDGELETGLILDLGKDGIKDSNRIAIAVEDSEIVYEITENSAAAYKANLKMTYVEYLTGSADTGAAGTKNTVTNTVFSISIDHNADTFEFVVPDPDTGVASVVIAGVWDAQDGRTAITVNSISYADKTVDGGFEIKLIIDEDDPMTGVLSKNDVTNALKLTQNDLQTIAETFKATFGNLFMTPEEVPPQEEITTDVVVQVPAN